MLAEVIIGPNGSIVVVVQEGNYENAQRKFEALLAKLKAQGFDISETKIERHRHKGQDMHVYVEVKTL